MRQTRLYITRARKTRAAGVVMDRLARDVEPQAAQTATNSENNKINDREADLAGRREPFAAVQEEPEDTAHTIYDRVS